jgi:hypothetical protein
MAVFMAESHDQIPWQESLSCASPVGMPGGIPRRKITALDQVVVTPLQREHRIAMS